MISPTIRFRNLGPIEEGEIRLHPLTVLIGKNNTGKTYVAQAVYSAFKAVEQVNGVPEPLLSDEEAEELIGLDPGTAADRGWETFGLSVRSKVEGWLRDLLHQSSEHLENRLSIYFDVERLAELRRWGSTFDLDVSVYRQVSGENRFLFGLSGETPADTGDMPWITDKLRGRAMLNQIVGTARRYSERTPEYPLAQFAKRRLSVQFARFAWAEAFLPLAAGLGGSAYYLPGGRSGLLEAWTDVVRLRLEWERDRLGLTVREPAALGGIALDFLSELLPLFRQHRRPRQSNMLMLAAATRLEKLIAGEITLGQGPDKVPSFTYTQQGREIPIQRASSMVAEVAPLLGWIKHILRPGDLLLIDEPEAHMHPEAILAVAETLVALAGAGVRVLCTTHSSEFLHQVSNCMLRSRARENGQPSDGPTIGPSEVGVYRFEGTAKGGTRIIAEPIDTDWGIPETEHVEVAERLSRETEELIRTIGG